MMDLVTWFDIIVIALVLGLVVASRFSDVAESFISKNIYKFENPSFLQFVAFIGLWLVFWLVCLLVGKFLSKIVSVSGLGFLDRLGGFVMGSGKIFLTFSAVVAVMSGTSLNKMIEPYFTNSKVYPLLLETGRWITNVDMKNIKNEIDEMVARPKDTNKTDAFISMDANASTNTDTNVTKGE